MGPERKTERVPIQPGLVVYCGPMFSGKSDELIKELNRAPHAGYKVQAFKPAVDNRRGADTINSQDGGKYPAIAVVQSREIPSQVDEDTDIVGIDEGQFLDEELPDICLELVAKGKRVIVAGLDRNFRGEPFGPMEKLIIECDYSKPFQAYCAVCGLPASFTQRLVNGKPAHYTEKEVVVGADELYQARCRKHHEVPGRPSRS